MGPLGDLQPPRMNKINSRGNMERETTASFFQGPKRAPRDLPCLTDTGSAFLHAKNKPSAGCGQEPAADVGQSPCSWTVTRPELLALEKGLGYSWVAVGRSRMQQPRLAEVLVQERVSTGATTWAAGGKHP